MRYNLAFVNECKKQYLWYKDELKTLLEKHGMSEYYDTKIAKVDMYRWWPEEIFAALESV